MSNLEVMIQKAPELGFTEVPTLRQLWDKMVEIGKKKYPIYNDYTVFRRIIADLMGFYCDKFLKNFTAEEVLLMYIMKLGYGKHWINNKGWE